MLNIEDSALVIIDIQDRLVQASKYGEEVAQNMTKVAKAAQILGIPVVVTEQYLHLLKKLMNLKMQELNK